MPETELTSSTRIDIARIPWRMRLEKLPLSAPTIAPASNGSPLRIGWSSLAPMCCSKRSGRIAEPGRYCKGTSRTAMFSGTTSSPRSRSRLATTTSTVAWRGTSLAFSISSRSAM